VKLGALPESVLTDQDSYPISARELAAAVKTFASGESGKERGAALAKILAQPAEAAPLLRAMHETAVENEMRVRCAQALAFMGDPTGASTLIAELDSTKGLDEGRHYHGWGWTPPSRLDSLILALGRTGDRRATGPILAKLEALETRGDFSHVRAIAAALEALRDPAAAQALAALLDKTLQGSPMSGHAIKTLEDARQWINQPARDGRPRYLSLRELLVARALFRCGDHHGIGRKVLMEYTQDLRGPFASHALGVLDGDN
jgi:HEAT repeat protein